MYPFGLANAPLGVHVYPRLGTSELAHTTDSITLQGSRLHWHTANHTRTTFILFYSCLVD